MKFTQCLPVIFISLLAGRSASCLAAGFLMEKVAEINSEVKNIRMKAFPLNRKDADIIEQLSDHSINILSGAKSRIDYHKKASEHDRDTARESIFHRVMALKSQGVEEFSILTASTIEPFYYPYLNHLAFTALHHMAAIEIIKHRAGFLYTVDDLIDKICDNNFLTFKNLNINSESVKDDLFKIIRSFSRETLYLYFGQNIMSFARNLGYQYPDIPPQWLVEIGDINDKRLYSGLRIKLDENLTLYVDRLAHVVAVEFTVRKFDQPFQCESLINSPDTVFFHNQYFIPKKEYDKLMHKNQATYYGHFKAGEDIKRIKETVQKRFFSEARTAKNTLKITYTNGLTVIVDKNRITQFEDYARWARQTYSFKLSSAQSDEEVIAQMDNLQDAEIKSIEYM